MATRRPCFQDTTGQLSILNHHNYNSMCMTTQGQGRQKSLCGDGRWHEVPHIAKKLLGNDS